MKNTVAFSRGKLVFVSQHLGDLDLLPGVENHQRSMADFQGIYSVRPAHVSCDVHPGYASTRSAESMGLQVRRVQHHEAHAWAALLEAGWTGPCAVVAWDGTGDGGDGTVWGGEFFLLDAGKLNRAASLRSFRLPGGEAAVRDPRRSLLGVLHTLGEQEKAAALFPAREHALLLKLLASGLNSPVTTSAGRLFDAMAADHGIVDCSFEGEAAMRLEAMAAEAADLGPAEPLPLRDGVYDWASLFRPQTVSPRVFHAALAATAVDFAVLQGMKRLAVCGGCFQNALLIECVLGAAQSRGIEVFVPRVLPPNDGAIAAGQLVASSKMR
jgi:hydrogenase maturation protein HypF